jgi:hypothetical protein
MDGAGLPSGSRGHEKEKVMKRTLAVLAGLAVAVALPALAGADENARPAKAKGKKAPAAEAPAKAVPEEEPAALVDDEAYADESAAEPRRAIRVLDNPYDISSFYRAGGGGGVFMGEEATSDRYPIAGFYRAEGGQGPYSIAGYYRADGGGGSYPIAGFYRQGGRGAYGGFWNSGYGSSRRGRGRALVGYRRSIGENGDLFLIAPFLAPVGPLSEAFLR